MLSEYEAGGPTGTMRDPNSTPMVTSWCGEKRPSHRRTVSYTWSTPGTGKDDGQCRIHLIYHILNRPAIQSSLCSPTAEPWCFMTPRDSGYKCWDSGRELMRCFGPTAMDVHGEVSVGEILCRLKQLARSRRERV